MRTRTVLPSGSKVISRIQPSPPLPASLDPPPEYCALNNIWCTGFARGVHVYPVADLVAFHMPVEGHLHVGAGADEIVPQLLAAVGVAGLADAVVVRIPVVGVVCLQVGMGQQDRGSAGLYSGRSRTDSAPVDRRLTWPELQRENQELTSVRTAELVVSVLQGLDAERVAAHATQDSPAGDRPRRGSCRWV